MIQILMLNKYKKYIIPMVMGASIGIILSDIIDSLMSFEIMVKRIIQASPYFKYIFGAISGALCGWIIIYNKN